MQCSRFEPHASPHHGIRLEAVEQTVYRVRSRLSSHALRSGRRAHLQAWRPCPRPRGCQDEAKGPRQTRSAHRPSQTGKCAYRLFPFRRRSHTVLAVGVYWTSNLVTLLFFQRSTPDDKSFEPLDDAGAAADKERKTPPTVRRARED